MNMVGLLVGVGRAGSAWVTVDRHRRVGEATEVDLVPDSLKVERRIMSDALRWGVLSTAKIGRKSVIPATQASARGTVTAIASRDETRARAVADELGIPKAYGSYEALLEDSDIDAVYNPLPNHLHSEWTIAAARAGKHVLCEKPLAMSVDQAREMIAACDEAGVKLMEAFMYRLHPQWQIARDLVAQGRIGELRAVHSWYSYNLTDPANIRNVREWGGGALMDIGCYCINVTRMMFGDEPDDVQATIYRHPEFGTDVLTSALLRFGDRHATFTCSTQVEYYQRVQLFGSAGYVEVEIPFNPRKKHPNRVLLMVGGDPLIPLDLEVFESPVADMYTVQADAFATAVLDGGDVPVPNQDSIANTAVIEAVFAAAGVG